MIFFKTCARSTVTGPTCRASSSPCGTCTARSPQWGSRGASRSPPRLPLPCLPRRRPSYCSKVGGHAPWPSELPVPRGQATHALTVQMISQSEAGRWRCITSGQVAAVKSSIAPGHGHSPVHFPFGMPIGPSTWTPTVDRLEQRAAICCPGEACRMNGWWSASGTRLEFMPWYMRPC